MTDALRSTALILALALSAAPALAQEGEADDPEAAEAADPAEADGEAGGEGEAEGSGDPDPTDEDGVEEPVEPAADPSPSVEELHDELRALKATMETALNERDVDTIIANVHEDVIFTTMNGDVVRGPDGVRDYFERMMEGDDRVVDAITSSFEADDLSILHGDDMAVSWGSSDDHYVLTDGDEFAVQARWSATMVRRDGRWLIASFHYSTNMFDNPVLEAQRTMLITVGVGVALILGLLGFVVGRRKTA